MFLGFGKSNSCRAFGDAVYLSDYWSEGAPSAREIENLLVRLHKFKIYQCYYSIGQIAGDGSFKYPEQAESFMWEADGFCQRKKYPMKFVAWLRNAREGKANVDLRSEAVLRNLSYCMRYLTMFKGVHLDFEFWAEEQGGHFGRLLEIVKRDYPNYSISVLARRPWLKWRGFAERITRLVGDVEVNVYDSGREGEAYAMWCSQQADRLINLLGNERLIVTVPAFHTPSERHPPGETLMAALRGLRHGIRQHAPARVRVALYREGEATEQDWKTFRSEWAH